MTKEMSIEDYVKRKSKGLVEIPEGYYITRIALNGNKYKWCPDIKTWHQITLNIKE